MPHFSDFAIEPLIYGKHVCPGIFFETRTYETTVDFFQGNADLNSDKLSALSNTAGWRGAM